MTRGPERLRLAVNALTQSGAGFGGTADALYYFPKLDRFVRFNNKIVAQSMFYTRDYARSHAFIEGRGRAEEATFRQSKHIAVLANDRTFIAIGHDSNTVSKRLVAQLPAEPYNAAEVFPPDYLSFLKTIYGAAQKGAAGLGGGRPLAHPVWGRGGVGT